MSEITKHVAGTFSWAEVVTTDQDGAKRFYSELFGWKINDVPMGPGDVYTLFMLRDKPVAAACKRSPEMAAQGVPPHWGNYIDVASADATAKKVEGLGGKLIAPPFDVMDVGRMAVLQDPTGAVVSLWEARQHPGAGIINEVGTMVWTELLTNDTAKAEAFYTALFGWKAEKQNVGDMKYTTFSISGQTRGFGGMMAISPEMGPMPPNWGVYFGTDDTDATVERTQRMGGKVLVPAMDIPGVGRCATLTDPQGAAFSVIKFAMPG